VRRRLDSTASWIFSLTMPPPPGAPQAGRCGKMSGMQLRIFTEPQQGASYDTLLAVARAAEDFGFDAFFRSDHYLKMGLVSGLPGPTDAWVTLAGLARETARIRLGTLMTPATFRYPGPLAITVAQVDQMSGGRVEFGFGAGWFAAEHEACGIPFPSTAERFDRLEEQLAIITGLWEAPEGGKFSFSGAHYAVAGSPGLPKPAQRPRPPVLIGGTGARRTPALAARYADEYNVPFNGLQETAAAFARVRDTCLAAGRDAASMTYSVTHTVCCGRSRAELDRRAAAIGRDVASLREGGIVGTPAEVIDQIAEYAKIGAQRTYLQVLDLQDLDHLELIAAEVVPQLGPQGVTGSRGSPISTGGPAPGRRAAPATDPG
jgi:F420-dependent oxidoreductase-like protein